MNAHLAGRHTLPDGSNADVTVNGQHAEVWGSNADGQATFTVRLPVSRVLILLSVVGA